MSITCLEFRQRTGADPQDHSPEVLEHRQNCRRCADFVEVQQALDARLEAALRIPVPEDLRARVIFNQTGRWQHRPARRHWLPIAAGLFLAAGLGFVLVNVGGSQSLPAEVVAHIEHEPSLLLPTQRLAEPVRVNAILNEGRVRLAQPMDNVIHAGLCPFRGRQVPHLVLRVEGEPVSVLLIANEQNGAVEEIHEDGYHGVIVPRRGGSLAIVAARPELVQPAREQLEAAVNWGI